MIRRLLPLLLALIPVLVLQQSVPPEGPHGEGSRQTPGGHDCEFCRQIQAAKGTGLAPGIFPAATGVPAERAANVRVFEDEYLRQKEFLVEHHIGEWLAIVGGELLPLDGEGHVAPAKTLTEARLAAEAHSANAEHRFLWRVGEEGDVRYRPTINSCPEWIGRTFFPLFAETLWTTPGGVFLTPPGDAPESGKRLGPGILEKVGPRAEMFVSGDEARSELRMSFVVSTGFEGAALMSAGNARALGLSLFEIPGQLFLDGQAKPMRRARAHFRVEDGHLDAWAPVGIRGSVPIGVLPGVPLPGISVDHLPGGRSDG